MAHTVEIVIKAKLVRQDDGETPLSAKPDVNDLCEAISSDIDATDVYVDAEYRDETYETNYIMQVLTVESSREIF